MTEDETIRELQVRWMQAWIEKDLATLERILAPDFTLLVSARPEQLIDRALWLRTAIDSYHGREFRYESSTVRFLGDLAVVASVTSQTATIEGVDRSGRFFITDVWRRTGETWQVVARFSSQPEPMTASARAVVDGPAGSAG